MSNYDDTADTEAGGRKFGNSGQRDAENEGVRISTEQQVWYSMAIFFYKSHLKSTSYLVLRSGFLSGFLRNPT